jgi:ureidoacrylate peracid hydrolase
MVKLEARPSAVEIDRQRTALVVVDMQNDFGARGGMFDRAGIDISAIQAAAEATRPVLDAARSAGIPIVYLQMQHSSGLSDLGPEDGPHWTKHRPLGVGETMDAPDGSEGQILIEDTWNTRIVDSLARDEGDHVVAKHRYSGFFETELDDLLHELGVKFLLFTGATTSVCVESTVRDAMFRDYTCIVLEDCTAEPIGGDLPRSNHEASLTVIETLLGWVSSSDALLAALASREKPRGRYMIQRG